MFKKRKSEQVIYAFSSSLGKRTKYAVLEVFMKENRMAKEPVKKLMLSLGLPMILSMALQALYNIVDSAFVSNMKDGGEAALNALTLAFPLQMLMVAIGVGTGVGVNALIARSLGENNTAKAGRSASVSVFLGFVITFAFMLFGLFGVNSFVNMQTQNSLVADMAKTYLRICTLFSCGIIFFSIFEKLLQATGLSLYSTIGQIAGAVINIVLDPILIYGWLFVPSMGVIGAAVATVIGQISGALIDLLFHLKLNRNVVIKVSEIKADIMIIKEIYSIGLPAIIAQALMSIMTLGLNIILLQISENMQTAYGLYYKIQQFVLFCAFGMRDAITPITSFAYGMKNTERVRESIKYGCIYTTIIMLLGFVLVEVFASPLAGVFGLSGETEALCISAMRIISISFVSAGLNIALQGVFQALDGGKEVMIIAFGRQLVFILPIAYLFAKMVLNGSSSALVWWTFPIGELITLLIAYSMLRKRAL